MRLLMFPFNDWNSGVGFHLWSSCKEAKSSEKHQFEFCWRWHSVGTPSNNNNSNNNNNNNNNNSNKNNNNNANENNKDNDNKLSTLVLYHFVKADLPPLAYLP